ADVFEVDVADSTQTVQQLIRNGLVPDATTGFDMLGAAFQRVPVAMRDELPELINEYGTFFSSLGFDGQEAFGLLVNASYQGQIAMDKVGDALKETGIRASDLGDTGAVEALDAIGLAGENIQSRLLEGGDVAREAFGQMVQALLDVQDPAEQAEAAVALFGTPLEDLNKAEIPAFLQAMSGAGSAMADFEGTVGEMGDALSQGPGAALEEFRRSVQTNLIDALGNTVQFFQENETAALSLGIAIGTLTTAYIAYRSVATIAAVIQGVTTAMQGLTLATTASAAAQRAFTVTTVAMRAASLASAAATWVATAATTAFSTAMTFLAANPIVLVIAGIVAALALFFARTAVGRRVVAALRDAVMAAWEGIKNAVVAAWTFIQPILQSVWEWITGTLMPAFMSLWQDVIAPAFAAIGALISAWW